MKILLLIAIASILQIGCSNRQNKTEFSYIKVITTGLADTFTAYNKGLGLINYAYYDLHKDSLIYRDLSNVNPERETREYKTYVGRLANRRYLDTIRMLVQVLKRHKNGIIPDTIPEGSTYCGPEFYVEFADSKGLHYNLFILDGNDSLSHFRHFFYRLPALPWQKNEVGNGMVNADREIVHAMNRLGVYEKREIPFIPQLCETAFDTKKIVGTWRRVGSRYEEKTNYYTKITIGKNGAYARERIEDDMSISHKRGRYFLNQQDSTLTISADSATYRYKIEKLTDLCFEALSMDDNRLLRLERLR